MDCNAGIRKIEKRCITPGDMFCNSRIEKVVEKDRRRRQSQGYFPACKTETGTL